MCADRVVPVHVVGNVGFGRAHAAVGLEVYPLVLDATPHPLDEHVVAPRPASIHRKLASFVQHSISELLCREQKWLRYHGAEVEGVQVLHSGQKRRITRALHKMIRR